MERRTSFKESFSEEIRLKQSGDIIDNYGNTIPVIVEKSKNSKLKEFNRKRFHLHKNYGYKVFRYIIPKSLKVYNLTCLIRKRMKLNRLYSLTLFVNGNELLKSGIFFNILINTFFFKQRW